MSEFGTDSREWEIARLDASGERLFFQQGRFIHETQGEWTVEQVKTADDADLITWVSDSERTWLRRLFFPSPVPAGPASDTPATSDEPSAALSFGHAVRRLRRRVGERPFTALAVALTAQGAALAFNIVVLGESHRTWGSPLAHVFDILMIALGYTPCLVAGLVGSICRVSRRPYAILGAGFAGATILSSIWLWGGRYVEVVARTVAGQPLARPIWEPLIIALPVITVGVISTHQIRRERHPSNAQLAGLCALGYFAGALIDIIANGGWPGIFVFEVEVVAAIMCAGVVVVLANGPSTSARGV